MPPYSAPSRTVALDEEDPRLDIQIDPAKHQNRIIEKGLVPNQVLSHSILRHEPLMVSRKQTTKELMVHGKEQ